MCVVPIFKVWQGLFQGANNGGGYGDAVLLNNLEHKGIPSSEFRGADDINRGVAARTALGSGGTQGCQILKLKPHHNPTTLSTLSAVSRYARYQHIY
jgi:hypothetical protein